MANIQLRGVTKTFGQNHVIHGVDLEIKDREFVAFVGPSGSGKSTLLRMIAGLEEVTGGDVLIDGVPAQHVAPAKRGLAMVFQSYALYPHMTVAENMSFNLRLAGVPKEEQDRKVRSVAKLLDMEGLLARKPRQLSGGQMQRVAIGRAMVRQPKAFLLDEPLSNLDAALQAQMRFELVRLHQELQTTMIYVTHDQLEAMTMADRIVVLNNGRVEQVGSPMELYRAPASIFVAGFIGAPKMNLISAVVKGLDSKVLTLNTALDTVLTMTAPHVAPHIGQRVTIGIRPEHVVIDPRGPLRGTVEVIEHLGARAYIHARLADQNRFVAEAPAEIRVHAGEQISFQIRGEMAHVFDSSGQTLS